MIEVEGKPMTLDQIAALIHERTGYRPTRQGVRRRIQKGWTGEKLLSGRNPSKRPAEVTTVIDGKVMSSQELSVWIETNRGYYVSPPALRERIVKGDTGEDLLRRSKKEARREADRRYKARARSQREVIRRMLALPRPEGIDQLLEELR